MAWRIAAGTAVSLFAGVAVTAPVDDRRMMLGAVAGYLGGIVDRLISGLIDLVWGFPVILVAVIFVGMLDPGLTAVILAVSVVNWAGFARIVRAQVLSLKERAFVEAARALGVPGWKIVAPPPGPEHARHRAGDGRRTTSPSPSSPKPGSRSSGSAPSRRRPASAR